MEHGTELPTMDVNHCQLVRVQKGHIRIFQETRLRLQIVVQQICAIQETPLIPLLLYATLGHHYLLLKHAQRVHVW